MADRGRRLRTRTSSIAAPSPPPGWRSTCCSTTLERELREALDACPDARAIGLGIPCTIDRERGLAITSVNLPIANVPIRDLIVRAARPAGFIDNDANVAALAEHRFGAARGRATSSC